ncbi:uncharacterized protein LOC112500947 [Cynara cardunculus var. scolymus]|uniref:Uncharacterized protein n=1 Tax=Cynara cardunculus var. scolymus TaxID=59895 RepID=A0A103YI98_CYNCS|nr:uncharacterized protein LOC112500947 [Cynara cardunculus var. scolymus]KVI09629.1 hypothetical protein Ccrd_011980 [Cynara cardunculus var. scolymus]
MTQRSATVTYASIKQPGVCNNARKKLIAKSKKAMSRHSSSRQTVEAAPPRLIRVDRRASLEKKLPTIKEDECSSGDQLQSFNGNRTVSSSAKTLYSTKHHACN